MEKIKSIEVDKWSEPDENHRVKHLGMIMANAVISPKFTIEDIHKIREENYEKTKNMTMAEKIAYYNGLGKEAAKEIEKRKTLMHV